jgi:hypothetical protein
MTCLKWPAGGPLALASSRPFGSMAAERVAAAFCSCSLRRSSAAFICDESTHASAKGFCRESLQASIVALMICLLRSSVIPRSSRVHARTHTRKHQHRNTCTRHLQSLDDDVLRHIFQHHIWVCLIIPDRIERSHLICFTCSTLFLRLYWNRIWQRGRGPLL